MLKKLAVMYVVFEIIRSTIVLYSGFNSEVWKLTIFWVTWPINLIGLLAVLAYAFNRKIFSFMIWRAIIVAYIGLRIYELIPNGLFVETHTFLQNALIGAHYAWLVVPSLLAIWYMGFKYEKNL